MTLSADLSFEELCRLGQIQIKEWVWWAHKGLQQLLNESIQFSGFQTYKATKYLLQYCFIHYQRCANSSEIKYKPESWSICDRDPGTIEERRSDSDLWVFGSVGGILGGFGIWDSNLRRAIFGLSIVDCNSWFDSDLNP